MKKCPNCGSTAQVRLVTTPMPSLSAPDLLVEGWSCGCGCHFSTEYKRNDEGILEFYANFIDYIAEKY